MGEPVDHRSRVAAERRLRMRRQLMLAGVLVMARQGGAGLTVDPIIAEAGVARGSFYKYFASPEALVREIALALAEEVILTVNQVVGAIEDPALRLATGLRAVLQLGRDVPLVAAVIARGGWPHSQPGHAFERLVLPGIEAGLASGRFVLADASVGPVLVGGLAVGGLHRLAEPGLGADFPAALACAALQALGIAPAEAADLAARPMMRPVPVAGGLIALCAKI